MQRASSTSSSRLFCRKKVLFAQLTCASSAAPKGEFRVHSSFVRVFAFIGGGQCGRREEPKVWRGPCWEGVWPLLDAWDVVGLRTTASFSNARKKKLGAARLFFFLIQKEPTIHEKVVVSERDTEDDSTFSDEQGERNVEKCCAHHACSPLCRDTYTRKCCVRWL